MRANKLITSWVLSKSFVRFMSNETGSNCHTNHSYQKWGHDTSANFKSSSTYNAQETGISNSNSDDPLAFMGSCTPYLSLNVSSLESLEKLPLRHERPVSLAESACLGFTCLIRWIADKFYRPRYIHRAFLLKALSSAPGAAAVNVESLRLMFSLPKIQHVLRAMESERECQLRHFNLVTQLAHPVCPATGHRFNAYLYEDSAVTLTQMANDIAIGKLLSVDIVEGVSDAMRALWGPRANDVRLRDVVLLMRADDILYRDINHELSFLYTEKKRETQ